VKNVNKERKKSKTKFQRLEKLLPQQNNIILKLNFKIKDSASLEKSIKWYSKALIDGANTLTSKIKIY
jgi:hypothetical protein